MSDYNIKSAWTGGPGVYLDRDNPIQPAATLPTEPATPPPPGPGPVSPPPESEVVLLVHIRGLLGRVVELLDRRLPQPVTIDVQTTPGVRVIRGPGALPPVMADVDDETDEPAFDRMMSEAEPVEIVPVPPQGAGEPRPDGETDTPRDNKADKNGPEIESSQVSVWSSEDIEAATAAVRADFERGYNTTSSVARAALDAVAGKVAALQAELDDIRDTIEAGLPARVPGDDRDPIERIKTLVRSHRAWTKQAQEDAVRLRVELAKMRDDRDRCAEELKAARRDLERRPKR